MIKFIWIVFIIVFGGAGVALIALGDLMSGFLMCCITLSWLFIANNTGHLFEDEDPTYDEDEAEDY